MGETGCGARQTGARKLPQLNGRIYKIHTTESFQASELLIGVALVDNFASALRSYE
jgi:hypothetical protein